MAKLLNRPMASTAFLLAAVASFAIGALAATSSAVAAPPAAAGDAVKGKVVFAKCAICHSVEAGQNKIGPTLAGVIGRTPASVATFAYSPAMKANTSPWTVARLDAYLTNPRGVVPGNKMIFAGLAQPADRANVIAYLSNPAAAK